MFNHRELSTVLAALDYWKREGLLSGGHELDIANDGGAIVPLSGSEIAELAARLRGAVATTDPWEAHVESLRNKYTTPEGYGGEHPYWTRGEWEHEVECADTLRGYWDWVAAKIEEEGDFDAEGCAVDGPSHYRGLTNAHS